MYMQQSIVKCESGLYNRQATYFIQKANEFKSSIWIEAVSYTHLTLPTKA